MKKNKYNFLKLLVIIFTAIFQYCSAAEPSLSDQLFANPAEARSMAAIFRDFSRTVGGTDSDPSPNNIEAYRRATNAAVADGVRRLNLIAVENRTSANAIWITSRLALFLGSIPGEHSWLTVVTPVGNDKPLYVDRIAQAAIATIKGDENHLAELNTDGPATNIFKVSLMFCAAAHIFPEMLNDATEGQIHALGREFDGVSAEICNYRIFEDALLEAERRAALLESVQLMQQQRALKPKEEWGFFARHSLSFFMGATAAVGGILLFLKTRR